MARDMTEEEMLAWAHTRKKDNETVVIARCPCCSNNLAIYVEQTARQELVPPTTHSTHQPLPSTDDKFRN